MPRVRRLGVEPLLTPVRAPRANAVAERLVGTLGRECCDHLIVLADSRVQIVGDVEDLLSSHYRLTGARRDPTSLPAGQQVVQASHTDRQSTLIVRSGTPVDDPLWTVTSTLRVSRRRPVPNTFSALSLADHTRLAATSGSAAPATYSCSVVVR